MPLLILLLILGLCAVPAGAATIFADNFTGTDLASITTSTPETGTGWTGIDTTTGMELASNAVYQPSTAIGRALYSADATYSTANYMITITFNLMASPGTDGAAFWLGCRYVNSGGIDGYFAMIAEGATTNDVRIYRVDDGVATKLSGAEDTGPINTDTFVFECNGSSIGLKKNGAYVINPITDATYSAAGKATIGGGEMFGLTALRSSGNSSITQFTVEDIAAAATRKPQPAIIFP
jgi:hypothetical protein